jgi:hypothetical protein
MSNTIEVSKPKRSKIIKMPKVESNITETSREIPRVKKQARRIKPETFDVKLERHFVVTIHQAFMYTKGLVFEVLQEETQSICVTESGETVTAYLH